MDARFTYTGVNWRSPQRKKCRHWGKSAYMSGESESAQLTSIRVQTMLGSETQWLPLLLQESKGSSAQIHCFSRFNCQRSVLFFTPILIFFSSLACRCLLCLLSLDLNGTSGEKLPFPPIGLCWWDYRSPLEFQAGQLQLSSWFNFSWHFPWFTPRAFTILTLSYWYWEKSWNAHEKLKRLGLPKIIFLSRETFPAEWLSWLWHRGS